MEGAIGQFTLMIYVQPKRRTPDFVLGQLLSSIGA
jgi:hypothetical protein